MDHDLKTSEAELNALTASGKILDGLEEFYAEDCLFQEGNDSPIEGKAAQRERLSSLFESLKGFNRATLHASSIGDGVTFSQWTFDMVSGDGEPMVWNEVLVRQWRAGKVAHERFYQA